MKKKISLGLALTLMLLCGICTCLIGVGIGASGQKQVVQATIDPSVKITVDGEEKSFFDANGSRVFPILYKGTTYLPLRDVCEKVAGFQVNWNQATRTTDISTRGSAGSVDLLDMQRAYNTVGIGVKHYMTADKETKEINGYTLTHWIECCGYSNTKGDYYEASFNIEGKYDTVTFRYYTDQDTTLQVIGDDKTVLWSKELSGGQLYQEVTVDLLKTNQLSFRHINKTDDATNSYIYDVRLK